MVTNHRAVLFIHIIMIEQLFFELIQIAIGNRVCLSHSPTAEEWKALYDMAKKQSLVGVCFAGVQRLPEEERPPEMLYLTWIGMAAKIQQRNEVVNAQCVEVQQMIEKAGFRTYIMKGQGNSALYKVSEGSKFQDVSGHSDLSLLRQSGDIDIYLEGGFEKVNAFVQRTCPTKEINELEIHYHCLLDTEVEIHYRPFIMRNPFKNRKLQRFFAMEGEKCFENKTALSNGVGEIAVPTTTFNLVHQMVHIYHHLLIGGVGMRQLMDYYFVLRSSYANDDANANVLRIISGLGLNRFGSALMWVLGEVFGLERSFMLWEPNEEDGRFLLNEVVLSGNFGNYDERLPQHRNKWQSFWMLSVHNLRLFRFTYDDWFWGPLWRIYHFAWRKIKGFE